MSWIKFRDKLSSDFGKMESVPFISAAEQNIITVEIPKSAPEVYMSGYKTINQTFTLNLPKNATEEDVHKIYGWLQGQGKLVTSREPTVYFDAICNGAKETEMLSRKLGRVKFSFTLLPFRRAIVNEQEELAFTAGETSKRAEINNHGTSECYPEYEFTASGNWQIWVHGVGSLSGTETGTFTINSEYCAMRKNGKIVRVDPAYNNLRLAPGKNTFEVSNSISSVKIIKNERWY